MTFIEWCKKNYQNDQRADGPIAAHILPLHSMILKVRHLSNVPSCQYLTYNF